MTTPRFHALFGGPPRRPDDPVDQRTMDLAASIQQVTDEIVLRLARTLRRETGERRLCLAGGVALNCVSNGRLAKAGVYDELWIQPAAGDAGGAVGAALLAWHDRGGARVLGPGRDGMSGSFLGPGWTDDEAEGFCREQGLPHERLDTAALADRVAGLLADGQVVGWMQGRMEFGPRALGNRSILADPRNLAMQRELNLRIKFRESFRPFAPAVLEERAADYFDPAGESPYMLLISSVRNAGTIADDSGTKPAGMERLRAVRSPLPAVTHVDGSARLQTVDSDTNPAFYRLIEAFGHRTGVPVLVNTSFNVRGEPIVCTPKDAYQCFMGTNIDWLVIGPCLLERARQPADHPLLSGRRVFDPD